MNFWENVTGSDMNKECKAFELRVECLPDDYQAAWKEIKNNLWQHSDFTGRNLMPIFDSVICMMEETVANGHSVQEVLGENINKFCLELVDKKEPWSYRDKLRKQLNNNIAKKLGK